MTLDADECRVLAAVGAEGVKVAETSGEPEEAEAPHNGHAADFLPGDLAGVLAASHAGGSVSVVVVSSEVDNCGASWGRSRSAVHGGGSHGLSVHRLCVHGVGLTVHLVKL